MNTNAVAASPRFCKLDDDGNELPIEAESWSQVLDRETNLAWLADSLDAAPWKKAMADASACSLGGFSWRAPTRRELLSIVDDTRFNPAFDPTFFRGAIDWYWTSSPWASSPGSFAWFVLFDYGAPAATATAARAFVRPVRSVAAPGQ